MADIAFLLIVFFMLTTVFSANRGIEYLLPETISGDDEIPAIFIRIFPAGKYEIDGESYAMDQLDEGFRYVAGRLQVNPTKPVILMTDRKAAYGDMIKVLDQLKLVEKAMGPEYTLPLTLPTKQEAKRYAEMMED